MFSDVPRVPFAGGINEQDGLHDLSIQQACNHRHHFDRDRLRGSWSRSGCAIAVVIRSCVVMTDRDYSAPTSWRAAPVVRWLAAGLGIAVSSWAAYAAVAWIRYGRSKRGLDLEESDLLMNRFMPEFEVAERHTIRVTAPADITFEAAAGLDMQHSKTIRGLFRARELMLGAQQLEPVLPKSLLPWAEALGWGVLAQIPGREVVLGAVTKPWESNVVFRPVRAEEFADFREPGYVKIIWTLRADPVSANESIARTDTRVTTTDPAARARFRLYWAFLSPGMLLIRRVALAMVKKEAERLASRSLPHLP
jgi:hypothetical protein